MTFAIDIGDSLQRTADSFFNFLPNLLGFLVILVIGWLIAKAVGLLVSKALDKVGLDRSLHSSTTGEYVARVSPDASPSRLIGKLVQWFLVLFALAAAVAALQIPALSEFVSDVAAFLPNVVVAVLIFVIAAALAGGAATAIGRMMGETPTGRVMQAVVPGVILAIGGFMVLDQLQIAPEIVTITYAGLITLLVLAGGLAFGLGGREVAADMLRNAYDQGRENQDLRLARERARAQRQGRFTRTPETTPTTGAATTPTGAGTAPTGADPGRTTL